MALLAIKSRGSVFSTEHSGWHSHYSARLKISRALSSARAFEPGM
jgi:hypothetical protein